MKLTVEKAFKKRKRFIFRGMEFACTEFDICCMDLGCIMSLLWYLDHKNDEVEELHREGYDIIVKKHIKRRSNDGREN